MNKVDSRSEILFIYDGRDVNPNGNPLTGDDMPRIDDTTRQAVVTDVRLKRYIRDQIQEDDEHSVFIKNPQGEKAISRDEAYREVLSEDLDSAEEEINNILDKCLDIRYFGGTFSFEDVDSDLPDMLGPVQFTFARTPHKVQLNQESKSQTTVFSVETDEDQDSKDQGTFSKDNRLRYALVPFYGTVNENAAKNTNLSEEDVRELDHLMWRSIKNQTLTRSKSGQNPRLYIRIEYEEDEYQIGGLDSMIDMDSEMNEKEIRNIKDYKLDLTRLLDSIRRNNEKIDTVHLRADDMVEFKVNEKEYEGEEVVEAFDGVDVNKIDVWR